jgi:hypothetical protein
MKILFIFVFCLVFLQLRAPDTLSYTKWCITKINEWNRFKNDFAFKESGNNPEAYNKYGYFGLYAFGDNALEDIELDSVTFKKFLIYKTKLFPVWLQDIALKQYTDYNWYRLTHTTIVTKDTIYTIITEKYIIFIDKIFFGVEISKSGLLAACHLVGVNKVRKFLRSKNRKQMIDRDYSDANGIKITQYLKQFKNYKI